METTYGYGHTKEAAALVRAELKKHLANHIKQYDLKISVRMSDSSYGGPSVQITTPHIALDRHYEYIIDDNGEVANQGKLVRTPVSETTMWHHSMRLVRPEALQQLNDYITDILAPFGRNNDDSMTDYFDNTKPLFYGVDYRRAA